MSGVPNPPSGKGRPRGSGGFGWRAFFHHSATPVFVLGKGKRLRYANPAWERLAGVTLKEALGMVCSQRRHSVPLAAALAPTPEALAGRHDRARRPAPPGRNGPPWWDVTFAPLASGAETPGDAADAKRGKETFGIVGFVTALGEPVPAAAKKVPASVSALRDRRAAHFGFDLLAGETPAAGRLVSQARLAASVVAPVWIVGEPGSGKETTARVIHHASANRDRAFVGIYCAGLQPYLVESLLFGHGGLVGSDRVGTLYLKEPAALPRDLQQRLADHFTDTPAARLICGSEKTAGDGVSGGALVPMFQTSLSAFEVRVPPLRERPGDLPRLATRLLGRPLDPAALAVLREHSWPVNLRELASTLHEAARGAESGPVLREHLSHELRVKVGIARTHPPKSLNLDEILAAVEKKLIQLALKKANNHQTETAELLGVFRAKLWRRLDALGIPIPPQPPKPRKSESGD
ncbi:sigma 54-interacting transcriptional regulator [Gemmata sp. JC717]|uniref:sigma 54-interacting transcriptional regulator n=1 Tax=Gemmata algarum TaxID=2975278 RepID=UPI0021BAB1E7|nr:sigma 54-interacting transcriptional regulator [Gemmata algarum]MDY3552484.1 sigma 54-interacting transcriptional regulator [Gemmata algarum]